ncbi:SOS response-associated peptidase [Defluviimonas sp. WL0002]|uniref:Abasic site processing protein n=1 Tax=Albidovulum marisflavi TaxID=2984159 RepID=A0ABT2ZGF5_9RHOB|nr:SOS response-associated peptidase [Defluviimonas sp. WL0002]MCV2870218.1 SOS response-associated peptidase [Defluviimonas sp. WL0002]
MCGRFSAPSLTAAQMQEIVEGFLRGPFRVDDVAPPAAGGYNIKPTQQVTVLGGMDVPVLTTARWWFVPRWFDGAVEDWKQTTFNARIESASEKPTFRAAWDKGRCVIPALGYFEWTGPKGHRKPWFISLDTNAPVFFFAGLASRLRDGTRTCTILTRPALPQIAGLHDRMPVIVSPDDIALWIAGEIDTKTARETLGTGWDGRFRFHRVAPLTRDSDGPEVIEPVGDDR